MAEALCSIRALGPYLQDVRFGRVFTATRWLRGSPCRTIHRNGYSHTQYSRWKLLPHIGVERSEVDPLHLFASGQGSCSPCSTLSDSSTIRGFATTLCPQIAHCPVSIALLGFGHNRARILKGSDLGTLFPSEGAVIRQESPGEPQSETRCCAGWPGSITTRSNNTASSPTAPIPPSSILTSPGPYGQRWRCPVCQSATSRRTR